MHAAARRRGESQRGEHCRAGDRATRVPRQRGLPVGQPAEPGRPCRMANGRTESTPIGCSSEHSQRISSEAMELCYLEEATMKSMAFALMLSAGAGVGFAGPINPADI